MKEISFCEITHVSGGIKNFETVLYPMIAGTCLGVAIAYGMNGGAIAMTFTGIAGLSVGTSLGLLVVLSAATIKFATAETSI